MTALRLALAFLGIALVAAIGYAATQENVFQTYPGRNIWVQVTIFDFYIGIALIAAWTIYRERRLLVSLPWVIGFVLTGNVGTIAYILWAMRGVRTSDDLDLFFHGPARLKERQSGGIAS